MHTRAGRFTPCPTVTLNGKVLSGSSDYKVTYEDNINVGTARVIVTGLGEYEGTLSADFKITKALPISVGLASISRTMTYMEGATYQLFTGYRLNSDGKLIFESSDPSVATVNDTGLVTIKGAGKTTLTIRVEETETYYGAVVDAPSLDVWKAENTMAAKAKKATVYCAHSAEKRTLTASNIAVSKAICKVTYVNTSTDALAKRFAVNKSTGKVALPKGIKVGTYVVKVKVTVAGDVNHTAGSKTVSYRIVVTKAANTLSAKAKKAAAGASLKTLRSKAVTLTSNVAVSKAKGAIAYANASSNATAKRFKINARTGKVTVPKGTKRGTYQVKVKVTAKGTAAYKAGLKTVTFKVKVA